MKAALPRLEDKLARADIIDISKLSGDTVKFGATVTLVDEDTEKKTVWQIVGEPEADAKRPHLHHLAAGPRADRQRKGSTVEVVAPAGPGVRNHQGRVAIVTCRLL